MVVAVRMSVSPGRKLCLVQAQGQGRESLQTEADRPRNRPQRFPKRPKLRGGHGRLDAGGMWHHQEAKGNDEDELNDVAWPRRGALT